MNYLSKTVIVRQSFDFEAINKQVFVLIVAIILLIPALFINLGELNLFFHNDEASRALVALEMKLSGNIITPTINGEYYLNIPPLYNWIILGSTQVLGGFNEFSIRIPSVIFLIIFSLSIFICLKPYIGYKKSFLVALLFITSGYIFFWESFFSFVDFGFSCFVFLSFMSFYDGYRLKRFTQMFILSYLFAATAFLMKGFPAIVFQVITISVFLLIERKVKLLFSYKHLIGLCMFMAIVGLYLGLYSNFNSPKILLENLWNQSIQQSIIEHKSTYFWNHLLKFPGEILYHLLPWTILLICLFRNDFLKIIRINPFLKFSLITFAVNILVYWVSPDFYPKNILIILPFLLLLIVHFYSLDKENNTIRFRLVNYVFLIAGMVIPLMFVAAPFVKGLASSDYADIKVYLLFQVTFLTLLFMFKFRKQILLLFLVMVILLRIAFDWFVWPLRVEFVSHLKSEAIEIAGHAKDNELRFLQKKNNYHALSFYVSRERNQIIPIEKGPMQAGTYYLLLPSQRDSVIAASIAVEEIQYFVVSNQNDSMYLVKRL